MTGVGLVLMVFAMPFALITLDRPLLVLGATNDPVRWNVDDAWAAVFVGVVAVVVLLAVVLRRPLIMGWASLPAAVVVAGFLLTASDIAVRDVVSRVGRHRRPEP